MDHVCSNKLTVFTLVQQIFDKVISELEYKNLTCWLNDEAKIPQAKNILKPDFTLCRRFRK